VIVLIGILRWPLLSQAVLPIGAMAVVGIGLAVLALRDYGRRPPGGAPRELGLKNPFRFWPAIKFAALFAVVLVVSKLVQNYAPGEGLYWVSGVAGSTDADAMVLSLTELHAKGEAATDVVVRGLVIACLANTLAKLGLLAALGTRQLAWRMVPATALMLGVGVAMLAL
jgi:uncharacterized membrane protein (DUF4010 family)